MKQKKRKFITVFFTEEQYTEVCAKAKQQGLTMSAYCRQLTLNGNLAPIQSANLIGQ